MSIHPSRGTSHLLCGWNDIHEQFQQYLTSDLHVSSDCVPDVVVLCVDVGQVVVVDVVAVLVKL